LHVIFKGLFFYYLQVSAWLHNSIDPVEGNDKKSDQYWYDVTSTYNSTTKYDRMRNRNQLKLRWERIKKPVTEFNGCYARISKVHQSVMSDDQKMDQALQLYASEHSDKPFTMVHVWRVLRHEHKWSAHVKKLNNEKDKSAASNPAHVVNVEDDSVPSAARRPKMNATENVQHRSLSTLQEATISQGPNPEMEEVMQRNATIRDRAAHRQLQSDLIEHIRQKFGN
jgi:hypothetical protein